MYRVAIHIPTGKLISSQTGGDNLDVLLENAVVAGYDAQDVETKIVTKEEFELIPIRTSSEQADLDDEVNRKAEVESERVSSGLRGITIAQARNAIDNIYGTATDFDSLKAANILFAKKILPYLLD